MWLGILQNEHPEIMAKIKAKLIQYAKDTEKKSKAPPGSYWFRAARPDDTGLGGTAKTYSATATNGAIDHLLAQAAQVTVPNANAYVSFGWYLDADPGYGGYFLAKKQNVTKSEVWARTVYEMDHPKHMYVDFDHVIFGEENELIDFQFYNAFGADQICKFWPLLFRIASRSALNLEEVP